MAPSRGKPGRNTVTGSDAVKLCGKRLCVPATIAELVGMPRGSRYDLVAELSDLGTVTFHLLQDVETDLNREKAELEEAARDSGGEEIDRLVAHEARYRHMTLGKDLRVTLTTAVLAHLGLNPTKDGEEEEVLYLYVRVRAGKLQVLTMERQRRFMLQNS